MCGCQLDVKFLKSVWFAFLTWFLTSLFDVNLKSFHRNLKSFHHQGARWGASVHCTTPDINMCQDWGSLGQRCQKQHQIPHVQSFSKFTKANGFLSLSRWRKAISQSLRAISRSAGERHTQAATGTYLERERERRCLQVMLEWWAHLRDERTWAPQQCCNTSGKLGIFKWKNHGGSKWLLLLLFTVFLPMLNHVRWEVMR